MSIDKGTNSCTLYMCPEPPNIFSSTLPNMNVLYMDSKGREFEPRVETDFFACSIFLIKNTYTPVKTPEKHDFERIFNDLTSPSWLF